MAHEQSKAAKRRFNIGKFHSNYFVGSGIDIGAGQDTIGNYRHVFRAMNSVRAWDMPDGDAQYLDGIEDNTFDFAVSSHSLEHMVDVNTALRNWIRVVKPGGYIIIAVPDEQMYERETWPSIGNSDHKWSFTVRKNSNMPKSINVMELALDIADIALLEKIEVVDDFYIPGWNIDQTMTPNAECAIEIIFRKL